MKRDKIVAMFAFAALAWTPAFGVYAADLPRSSAPAAPTPVLTQWEFGVSGYAWASGVRGTLATLPPAEPAVVNVGFDEIVKNLGGALMGTFEAKYGRFILFNDFLFTKLNPENASASIDSVSLIGLSAVGYRVIDDPNFIIDVFAGARGFYMDNKLTLLADAPPYSKGDSLSASKSWVDAVGGVRLRYTFDESWFVNLITFAGGGASNYQWDVYGGAGYVFNRNWAAFMGYRALKVNYRDGDFIYDVLQHGPVAGVQYRW